jgi:hypothetical protein
VLKKSSKKAASKTSSAARKAATSRKSKGASGSALSQLDTPLRRKLPTALKDVVVVMIDDGRVIPEPKKMKKSFAGRSLSQVKNPRSGRFVMVDQDSGTIISHKKSRGAYKGVAIVENSLRK